MKQIKQTLLDTNPFFKNIMNWMNPFSPRSLKVWGANVASLKSKGDDLKELLDQQKPDVVLLNETWLQGETMFDHPSYLQIASNFYQKHQGTSILLKKDTNNYLSCYQVMHKNKNLTEIVLKVDPENKIHFISVYAPPQGNDERDGQREDALNDFYSTADVFKTSNSYKCIGYSDFNAKLRTLVDHQDGDAKNLLRNLRQVKLKLIYDLKPSSYTRSGINSKSQASQSYIDYFFYRNLSYKRFRIKQSVGKSDHCLLEVKRNESSFGALLDSTLSLLENLFSDNGFATKSIVQIKDTVLYTIPGAIGTQSISFYAVLVSILMGFSVLIYIFLRFNIFFQ